MAEMKDGPTGKGPAESNERKLIRFTFGQRKDPKVEAPQISDDQTGLAKEFMSAVTHNKTANAVELLGKGAAPNVVDANGTTAMHIAAFNGNAELCEELIKLTGSQLVNVVNSEMKTPLDMAFDNRNSGIGNYPRVIALLKINKGRWLSPNELPMAGEEAIDMVVSQGLTIELNEAAEKLDLDYAAKLLRAGANINPTMSWGESFPTHPLSIVIMKATHDNQFTRDILNFAGYLIDNGAKVQAPFSVTGGEPITILELAYSAYVDVRFKSFVQKMKNMQEANEMLLDAAAENDVEKATKALAMKADINTRMTGYLTPLHLAVLEGNTKMVKFAIDNGAEIDAVNFAGNTVLHLAAGSEKTELLDTLLQALKQAGKNIGINTGNDMGNTPLHEAVGRDMKRGKDETLLDTKPMVEKMATLGADVNAQNEVGMTPLQLALLNENPDMTGMLFSLGAKVNDYLISFAEDFKKNPAMAAELRDAKQMQDDALRQSGVVELPRPQPRAVQLEPLEQTEAPTNLVEFVPFEGIKKPDQ